MTWLFSHLLDSAAKIPTLIVINICTDNHKLYALSIDLDILHNSSQFRSLNLKFSHYHGMEERHIYIFYSTEDSASRQQYFIHFHFTHEHIKTKLEYKMNDPWRTLGIGPSSACFFFFFLTLSLLPIMHKNCNKDSRPWDLHRRNL